ncbi:hypothetical protein YY96_04190 [Campylobacter fetus]|nr:hypothetical protein [Campylobacter fetus]OCS19539.1 hypothetical protein CFFBT1098_01805 [Campylobacter fetus subsp. fetus BT 10/98]EAI7233334.1 hypothetical protein [Campylobacter fetus]EAJ5690288.1 hypothetical protein [Campylobacter fetus]EAK0428173.1 hypothetical protein [Campylobacter fetus]
MRLNSLFIVFIILLLLFLSGGALLWKFSQVGAPHTTAVQNISNDLGYSYKEAGNWFEKIAAFTKNDSILPTNLMFIEINDNAKFDQSQKYFELVIDRCDFYSVFCITRVANEFKVNLTIVKKGDDAIIHLNTDDKKAAQDIVSNLKKYNIHSKIKED